jgi:molybdopterin-guanine dinucleotide biosynthesis protein A
MKNIVNTAPIDPALLSHECLGVVLAGGLSSRMGNDKAKLVRGNNSPQSMLAFSKQTLTNSGINNIVVSGDHYDIPDKVKKSGPVGGILSVLAKYPNAKSLLILPVDLPFMTAKALTDLRIKGELSQKATFFEGHSIPLYLPNSSYVELFLAQTFAYNLSNEHSQLNSDETKKGPSIKALLKNIPHQAIQVNDKAVLFNTNTPEQWQQAKQQFNF